MTSTRLDPPWTKSGWMDTVRTWVEAELARCGHRLSGPIEQPHVRLWSTVLRVPTSAGTVFFKACAPVLVHEVAVTRELTLASPQRFPRLLASDAERGWMLMADGGATVREFTKADGDIRHWLRLMPEYAQLQLDLVPRIDDLVALGLPDRRLGVLPERIGDLLQDADALLLGQEGGLTEQEHQRLLGMNASLRADCNRLAGFGIPESVHHGDFHDANVFARGDGFLFFDWGDASASHPFVSLRTSFVCLEYVLGLEEKAPEFDRLRDAYLGPWSSYGTCEDLREAFRLASVLSPLPSVLSWHRVISSLSPEKRGDYAGAVPGLLKEFLERRENDG